jgi:hypothetical protein
MSEIRYTEFTGASDGIELLTVIAPTMSGREPSLYQLKGAVTAQVSSAGPVVEYGEDVRIYQLNAVRVQDKGLIYDGLGRCIIGENFNNGLLPAALGGWIVKGEKTNKRHERGKLAVLSRAGDTIYGHWLLDILYKVYYLERHTPDVRYLISDTTPKYVYALLAEFGVDNSRVIQYSAAHDHVLVESLLHVSPLRRGDHVSPLLSEIYKGFHRTNLSINEGCRFFLSRQRLNTKRRLLLNASELEAHFVSRGFEVVYPELLTISEQKEMFTSCSVLAGEAGSALHNSVYMPAGTHVFVLQSRSDACLIQAGMCQAMNQSCTILFGESLAKYPGDRDASFLIDPHESVLG